ncbi:MAG: DNA polymerase III subunit gamma/tau, partial [Lactococcus garvieae]
MAYQALYRKYRSQRFDEMVGQEVVATTLKNAIVNGQISHAYLFSGPRGTGKTSAAKIFAKAINCPNQKEGEPCNTCDICQAITQGSLEDVIELDAASNNGVDEIREIRDKSTYAASRANYKVYIIDEVHMLSTGAFNALLKTLEEPTDNVVFVLATTE